MRPKRDWNKYIHKNRTCGDCQLVTAVNAYYYLTGKTVEEKEYMEFAEECGCTHGACISVEKAWKKLGIKIKKTYRTHDLPDGKFVEKDGFTTYKLMKLPLPIEISVWHRKCGLHSVLIVDQDLNTDCFRITNFPWETNDGWMFRNELYKFLRPVEEFLRDYDIPEEVKENLPKEYPFRREKYVYRLFGLEK